MALSMIWLSLVVGALNPTSASSVIELTDVDFSRRTGMHETMLVMFYAPWCMHCQKLKPEFEKASDLLLKNDPPVYLAKVDCTGEGKATCSMFGVSSFPILKIFKHGKFSKDYPGPRYDSGIVKYMASQVEPATKEISADDEFEKFLSTQEHNVVVGFFQEGSSFKDTYLQVADTLRDNFRFAMTSQPDLLSKYELANGIRLFRPKHLQNNFEPSHLTYHGDETKSAMESWLLENQHSLVGIRTPQNMNEFKNPLVVAYYIVDYEKNPKMTNYWRNRILKIAKNFASDFTFAISSSDFSSELTEFGLESMTSGVPKVVAFSNENKKFVMSEDFSQENFEAFLNKLKNNELKPYLKSESIPKDNSRPVKIAVGYNFDEIVTNNNKDTFIEFYAPWCGHCKQLAPIWDKLGEKMADEDIAIVKMDSTRNEIPPPYKVTGYPTIYWAPKDDKSSPVAYKGERKLSDLINYIAKQATSELNNYDRSGNPKHKDEL